MALSLTGNSSVTFINHVPIWDLRYLSPTEVQEQEVCPGQSADSMAPCHASGYKHSPGGPVPLLGGKPLSHFENDARLGDTQGQNIKEPNSFIIVKVKMLILFSVCLAVMSSLLCICVGMLGFHFSSSSSVPTTPQGISFIADCKGTWCVCKFTLFLVYIACVSVLC